MRRIVILVLGVFIVATVGLMATGTKESAKPTKTIVIGGLMSDFSDQWLSYLYDAEREEAAKLGVTLELVDCKNDAPTQLGAEDTLIAKGVDALIAIPINIETFKPIIEHARAAKIPLIVVNRTPTESPDLYTAFVGSQEVQAGLLQMGEIARLLKGKGNIGLVKGWAGHPATIGRTDGDMQVLAKNPDMKVAREGVANYSRADGLKLMEDWIQSGTHLDAVVANNDEMAIGAILAIQEAKLQQKILVAGVDATPAALEMMKKGLMDVTVFQDAKGQGEGAVRVAVAAVKGEKFEKMNWIPFQLVTSQNMDQFIKN